MEFTDREKRLLQVAEQQRPRSHRFLKVAIPLMCLGALPKVVDAFYYRPIPEALEQVGFLLLLVGLGLSMYWYARLFDDACSLIRKLKQDVSASLNEEGK